MTQLIGPQISLHPVEVEDAAYILSLRQDPNLNAHLSATTPSLADQRSWIMRYKAREAAGTEIYFLIRRRSDGAPCGTLRLYEIGGGQFTWGSWILAPNKPRKAALESALLIYRHAFGTLKLERAVFDVRRDNLHTLAFHDRFGATRTGEDAENIYYVLTRPQFEARASELEAVLS